MIASLTKHRGIQEIWVRCDPSKFSIQLITILICLLMVASCIKAPGTARDQIIFISEEKEISLGKCYSFNSRKSVSFLTEKVTYEFS